MNPKDFLKDKCISIGLLLEHASSFGFESNMGKGESPFKQTAKSQMFISFIINIHANIFSSDNWLVVRS